MTKNIKSIFIYPPHWTPTNPKLSLISIVSYLKEQGVDSQIIDMNIDFFDYVLSKDYIISFFEKAIEQLPDIVYYLNENKILNKQLKEHSVEYIDKYFKYKEIIKYKKHFYKKIINVADNIHQSIAVLKNKKLFYQPEKLIQAYHNIDFALKIVSLPYFPTQISLNDIKNSTLDLSYEGILNNIKNVNTNIFIDFYINKIKEIKKYSADLIGISIGSFPELISGLTLAYLLKKEGNAKIAIGGNYISRLKDEIIKNPQFFDDYCDFILVENGEIPALKLIKHLENKIKKDEIPNCLYKENNIVVDNKIEKALELADYPVYNFDDLNFAKYYTPSIILPIQSSQGCYWQKCAFCDHHHYQKYNVAPCKKIVYEIEHLYKEYNIQFFEFVDECITPNYINNLSDLIIKKKLNIKWLTRLRMEKGFTYKILKNASKAGLIMISWGFESANKRIMKLINKGGESTNRKEIIRLAHKSKISNHLYLILGFPGETQDEAQESIDFIKENLDIIFIAAPLPFILTKHSRIAKNPEQYEIKEIKTHNTEFALQYECSYHNSNNAANNVNTVKNMQEVFAKNSVISAMHRNHAFLYLNHFGEKKLKKMKINLHFINNIDNYPDLSGCPNCCVKIIIKIIEITIKLKNYIRKN